VDSFHPAAIEEMAAKTRAESRALRLGGVDIWVDPKGLTKMIQDALCVLNAKYMGEKKGEVLLPWNFSSMCYCTPLKGVRTLGFDGKPSKKYSAEDAEEILSTYARFAGWVREAGPRLRRLMRATQGPGMNSPRTTVNLWELWGAYPSPGRLERRLAAVQLRANEILSPFGVRVASWAGIARGVVVCPRSVGKAAVVAALVTLNPTSRWVESYRAARQLLVELTNHGRVLDHTRGQMIWIHKDPEYSRHGIRAWRGVCVDEHGRRSFAWLVKGPGGQVHHYLFDVDPVVAVKQALCTWKGQRDHERDARLEHPQLFEQGAGRLVLREEYVVDDYDRKVWSERFGKRSFVSLPEVLFLMRGYHVRNMVTRIRKDVEQFA